MDATGVFTGTCILHGGLHRGLHPAPPSRRRSLPPLHRANALDPRQRPHSASTPPDLLARRPVEAPTPSTAPRSSSSSSSSSSSRSRTLLPHLATVAAPLGLRREPALRVLLLVLGRVRELLPAVLTH